MTTTDRTHELGPASALQTGRWAGDQTLSIPVLDPELNETSVLPLLREGVPRPAVDVTATSSDHHSNDTAAVTEATGTARPRRVLVVGLNYAPEPTGIAPYTAGLARGLASGGSAVHVISTFPHYPQWQIQDGYSGRVRHEDEQGVSITRLRPRVPRNGGLLARLRMEVAFGLRATIAPWRQPEVAVLVSPALFSTAIAMVGARLRGVPTCVWVQDIYSLGLTETGRGRALSCAVRSLERQVLLKADSVVVIHERFRRHLLSEFGLSPAAVTVVRNWTHLEATGSVDRAATRVRRGWGEDDVIVLHAGNMGAKQGLENVVSAGKLARERQSRVRFVLLGDGNRKEQLMALDDGDVEFIEPLPDHEFQATLNAADVLLVNERTGLKEMCVPSKLTSYFSTGLPVVAATDAGSITAEELALAGAGVRVDPTDPAALLEAAEELAADPGRSSAYGAAGRAFRTAVLNRAAAITNFRRTLTRLVQIAEE